MSNLELVHSDPPPEIERAILRLNHDARFLRETITKAQARSAYRIIEQARDHLSKVLERADKLGRVP